MSEKPPRSPARLLAPVALVVAVVAVVLVLASSGGGDGNNANPSGEPAADTSPSTSTAARTTPAKKKATTYTVKTGDSLGSIAEKSGLTIEKIQELNPDADPQSLVAGQKIKLTE